MKRAKSRRSATPTRGKKAPPTIAEYVAGIPESSRKAFNELRAAIRSAVSAEAVEVISYRIPAFKHQRILVWFAAFANHCSLFPTAAVIEAFRTELKSLSTSKGTIHFPIDRPIPAALVKKLVKARVAQVEKQEH